MPTMKEIISFRKKLLRSASVRKRLGGAKTPPFSFIDLVEEYPDATYYLAFGERVGGKTYSALDYALADWAINGNRMVYIRRRDAAVKQSKAETLFDPFIQNGYIEFITDGKYNSVMYYARKWYFCKTDETGARQKAEEPFAYSISMAQVEDTKSSSYINVKTFLFDEFITRNLYYNNELALLANIISTVVRGESGAKVFMAGNTVNKHCPYFSEMGLKHALDMKPGTIDVYTYGDSRLKVVVQRTKPGLEGKESDYYFAFDNPRLKMITDGAWEVDVYPHLPEKYLPKQVRRSFFIKFDTDVLKCDIVKGHSGSYIYIMPHTSEIKYPDKELIYSPEYDVRRNWRRNIMLPVYPIEKYIYQLFRTDKVFYATNTVGEVVRNYLIYCGRVRD